MTTNNPRKPKQINPETLGDTPAHETLSKLLNQIGNDHLNRKVISCLSAYNTMLRKLSVLDRGSFDAMSNLMLHERRQTIMASPHYPELIKTYLLNCLATNRKKIMRNEV